MTSSLLESGCVTFDRCVQRSFLLCVCVCVCVCGHVACGILGPQPETEAMPPTLEGEVFTTTPPGRSLFPMRVCTDTIRPSEVAQSCPTLCDPMDCSLLLLRPWDFPSHLHVCEVAS